MPRSGALLQILLVGGVTAAFAWLQQWPIGPLTRAELAAGDLLARVGRKAPADPSLVFLAIDNASVAQDALDLADYATAQTDPVAARALEIMAGDWPWSREIHALVLDRLFAAGARAVVIDLMFPKESVNDGPLAASLARHRDRVVVAANFVPDAERALDTESLTFATPTDSLIPAAAPRDDRLGYDNFFQDLDGVVRAARFQTSLEEVLGRERFATGQEWSLAARAAVKAGASARIPSGTEHRLRFAGEAGSFPPRSIFQIFTPQGWAGSFGNGAFFRDKIVVIGASGNWQQDEHLTPFGMMPGAELHLNALNAVLTGSFIHQPSRAAQLAIVIGAGLLAGLLWLWLRRPLLRFAVLVTIAGGWLLAALLSWNAGALLLPMVAPLCAFIVSGVIGLVGDVLTERVEKGRVRATLERYVSHNVVREMIEQPGEYMASLGGVVKPVTILFSDIRNFTRVSAHTESHALVAQLNEYLTEMVDCVFRHGGTLDKFIGDAVMAVWGNVRSEGAAADARAAVRCALAMRGALVRLNARWREEGRTQLDVGIGLNHGDVIVGNIGSPQRMEFTVIGDAVNVSWRLQERTKHHGCELLVGARVAELIAPEFATEMLGELRVGEGEETKYARLVAAGGRGQTAQDSEGKTLNAERRTSNTEVTAGAV